MADPRFVVQHHRARADHYDFRLEIDGVLVSWAVPKGPSLDPQLRRMAKRVGDHALEHADFEGVISREPDGRHRPGTGVVQVWDAGTFRNVSERGGRPETAEAALDAGHLSFVLAGQKLRGRWSLIRTRGEDMWLLIKKKDADAAAGPDPVTADDRSVLTGRTMLEIDSDFDSEFDSDGMRVDG